PKARFHHVMLMGSSGAGKSSIIYHMLRDELEHYCWGRGHKLFIWDLKDEMYYYLEPYRNGIQIDYLNPILEHGVGIAFARDVATPMAANRLAEDFISPDAKGGNAVNMEWIEGGRRVFSEIVQIFQLLAPDN